MNRYFISDKESDILITVATKVFGLKIGDIINMAIKNEFLPMTEPFRTEATFILQCRAENKLDAWEIKQSMTRGIRALGTRPVYDAYRKAGYSKRFLENHRAEITLHKAAKMAFDEAKLKKLPKVKELDAEYSKLLTEKKAAYPDYRKAKDEMQELLRAQRNVELFFAEEKNTTEKTQSR